MKALSFAGFRCWSRGRVAVAEKLWLDCNPAPTVNVGSRLTVVGGGSD